MKRKCLKICCFITALFILLLIVTFVTLYFTVFKQKQPQVIATLVNLEHFEFNFADITDITLNVALGVQIVIKNPNYAGFKYHNSTTFIFYHGELVGQAEVEAGTINARSTETIFSSVDIQVIKVIDSIYIVPDIISSRSLNFTSSSRIEGKVILLDMFKLHASTLVSCDISVFVFDSSSSSSCSSEIDI